MLNSRFNSLGSSQWVLRYISESATANDCSKFLELELRNQEPKRVQGGIEISFRRILVTLCPSSQTLEGARDIALLAVQRLCDLESEAIRSL